MKGEVFSEAQSSLDPGPCALVPSLNLGTEFMLPSLLCVHSWQLWLQISNYAVFNSV
jgi:hypothetical protein